MHEDMDENERKLQLCKGSSTNSPLVMLRCRRLSLCASLVFQPSLHILPNDVLPPLDLCDIVYLESKDPWSVSLGCTRTRSLLRHQIRIDLKKHVGKTGSVIGTIDGRMARRFGVVYVFAFRAVELDCFGVR